MGKLFIPQNYHSLLTVKETELAIVRIKDFFQTALSTELNLTRVTAPLFVAMGQGLNDDLSGTERPVTFPVKDLNEQYMEIVHSLAKWKRVKVGELSLAPNFGIYTDMNAIRADETLDNIHSLYVDQWDWERVMRPEERNLDYLRKVVRQIYSCLKRTEFFIFNNYPALTPRLPEEITFIHSEELLERYPGLSAKERENAAAKEFGAIFIIGIGYPLKNGEPHDGRAPDYDDWITPTVNGWRGLNGDLIVWNDILQQAFELSSMGIRVSPDSLGEQLVFRGAQQRKELYFHDKLLHRQLPQTIGGGIGQSRLCMYFLKKAHVGETQVSVWPPDMAAKCRAAGIELL